MDLSFFSDPAEKIAQCLSCPLPECLNCIERGGESPRTQKRSRYLVNAMSGAGLADELIASMTGLSSESVKRYRRELSQ